MSGGWPTVGVAGARGVVGSVFCSILADAGLPAECLRAFGHEEGNTLDYRGWSVAVHVLTDENGSELDVRVHRGRYDGASLYKKTEVQCVTFLRSRAEARPTGQ